MSGGIFTLVEAARRSIVVAMNGCALSVAYLINNMDVGTVWTHDKLARGCGVQGLHARSDHLQGVRLLIVSLQASSMAYLVYSGDGCSVVSDLRLAVAIFRDWRWLVGREQSTLSQVAVRA